MPARANIPAMDATSADLLSYGLGAVAALLSLALLAHIVPYTFDILGLKTYPGPFLAQFSELWIGWNAARGRIVTAVADAHKTYGTSSILALPSPETHYR